MAKFFQVLGIVVATFFLVNSLFFLANTTVFSIYTSKPEKVKQLADDSQVYQKLPGIVYDNVAKDNQDPEADINLQDPEVKEAFLNTLTPDFFKTNAEKIIDGTYTWLDGKTDQPEFTLDFTDTKSQLINSVVDLEAKRAEALPKCTLAQIRELRNEKIDIFNLECVPPGINVQEEAEKAKAELANTTEVLDQPKLSASDIKGENGQPVFQEASNAPEIFQWLKRLPFLALFLVAMFSFIIYALSETKKKGLMLLGKIYIIAGILVAIAPLFVASITSNIVTDNTGNDAVSQVIKPLLSEYNAATAGVYYAIGLITILLGIAAIIYSAKKLSALSKGPTQA